ncbi:MAG: glycoside hydrolase, partial [Bacteroidota bacterium]
SAKNKAKLNEAAKSVKQYEIIKSRIDKAMQLARRNDYAIEVMNQVNELQVYSSKLLLMLAKYDKASFADKRELITQLRDYVAGFSSVRAQFEKIYSQTRILGNPEGYQLDNNVHGHLANGTNNTDWMFMYELPLTLKLTEWLKPKGM